MSSLEQANARINARFTAGMNPAVPNARFWVYVNGGPVKLTLTPGQSLHYESGGDTDEGWSFDYVDWTYTIEADGPYVTRQWCQEARDCDGRFDQANTLGCTLDNLAKHTSEQEWAQDRVNGAVVAYPVWDRLDSSQRDHSAEAMGY